MTRLTPRTLFESFRLHPLLPLLLRECRSLDVARNELRWLRRHAVSLHNTRAGQRTWLKEMCRMRSRGVPLQYILGDQPFGDLEILCGRGVLIPRPETESYTTHTAQLILQMIKPLNSFMEQPLRIVDLCTGTGCIALLLHALLAPHFDRLAILGVDLSPAAIDFATRNLEHNIQQGKLSSRARSEVCFRLGDVLRCQFGDTEEVVREKMLSLHSLNTAVFDADEHFPCDVLVSNPPYISPSSFWNGTTSRSVRIFEPTMALVPPIDTEDPLASECDPGDRFYHHIVALSLKLRPKLTVLECGDRMQAKRVVAICRNWGKGHELQVEIYPGTGDGDFQPCAVIIT